MKTRCSLINQVEGWDKVEEIKGLEDGERLERWQALKNIWELNRMEEVSWRQKSRALWLKEGDKNTKFFHRMANVRKKVNFIRRLNCGGVILDNSMEIKEEVAKFFENLLRKEIFTRPTLNGVSFPSIQSDHKDWLKREFEPEEISKALADCASDKAPGPDGFNFSFIKAGWDFLRDDFCDMLKEFHERGKLNKESNSTFITFVPKISNPVKLKDFRPISLVGCTYKLLAKILANRLKIVLPNIISPFQGAFVQGMQILDGILILMN